MLIDRREFVTGAALVTLAPTPALPSTRVAAPSAKHGQLVMKIEGWTSPDQSGADDEIWIKLDRSWRAAWR